MKGIAKLFYFWTLEEAFAEQFLAANCTPGFQRLPKAWKYAIPS
jgi:hypothetical protein